MKVWYWNWSSKSRIKKWSKVNTDYCHDGSVDALGLAVSVQIKVWWFGGDRHWSVMDYDENKI